MHTVGMTVCVDYAELLAKSLDTWHATLDTLVVVTAARDQATQRLCAERGIIPLLTDLFWADGARFNKGRAMALAYEQLVLPELREWMLFFDADIQPPADWREQVAASNPAPGNLYGCYRTRETGELFSDPDIAGFFHFAHVSDPHMQVRPIVATQYYHAGNYDSDFQNRWDAAHRVRLPLQVIHHGDDPGANWCGVGHSAQARELQRRRRRQRGASWQTETLQNNPFVRPERR